MEHAATETLSRPAARAQRAAMPTLALKGRDRAIACMDALAAAVRAGARFRSREVQALVAAQADAWREVGLGVDDPELMTCRYAVRRQALKAAFGRMEALYTFANPQEIGRPATKAEQAALEQAKEAYYAAAAELLSTPAGNDFERDDQIALADKLDLTAADLVASSPIKPAWPDRYDTAAKWREIAPHFTDTECASMAAKTAKRIADDEPRYADLAEKFQIIDLPLAADHAMEASRHGFPFNGYIEDNLRLLSRDEVTQPDPRVQWDAAVSAYEVASAAYEALEIVDNTTYDQLFDRLPAPFVKPGQFGYRALRWDDIDDLQAEFFIGVSTKEPLKDDLALALAAWKTIQKRYHYRARPETEALEAGANAVAEAAQALLKTPAPDLRAAVYKSAVSAAQTDDLYCFDDLGAVLHALSYDYESERRVRQHMELLRLAGVDHPILHLPDFSPQQWVEAFEAAGGVVGGKCGTLYIVPPKGAQDEPASDILGDAVLARAVYLYCDQRWRDGGCSIFNLDGAVSHRSRVRDLGSNCYTDTIVVWMTGEPKRGRPGIAVERPADRDLLCGAPISLTRTVAQ